MTLSLRTTIEKRGPAAAIVLTDDQVAQLGPAKAMPVTVTVAGTTRQLGLGRMGGENLIGLSTAARGELGVEAGDEVNLVIAVDTTERSVEVPSALAAALADDARAAAAFEKLSYSRRKEMARQVAEAKQEATRQRRLDKVLAELRGN